MHPCGIFCSKRIPIHSRVGVYCVLMKWTMTRVDFPLYAMQRSVVSILCAHPLTSEMFTLFFPETYFQTAFQMGHPTSSCNPLFLCPIATLETSSAQLLMFRCSAPAVAAGSWELPEGWCPSLWPRVTYIQWMLFVQEVL